MRLEVASVATAALLFASCQVAPMVHLLNASGRDVEVHVMDEVMPLSAERVVAFAYPYSASGGMSIRSGECTFSYRPPDPPPPPSEFMRNGWRGHVNVRLEPDGSLVVLEPRKEVASAAPLALQPLGFPVVPERDGDCR